MQAVAALKVKREWKVRRNSFNPGEYQIFYPSKTPFMNIIYLKKYKIRQKQYFRKK